MLPNQRKRPLLRPKRGAFFNPYFGPFGVAAEGREYGHVGVDAKRIIAPVARGDHPPIKVEDASELAPVERGNRAPVPSGRERRDDAQALLILGRG